MDAKLMAGSARLREPEDAPFVASEQANMSGN
jgi:hypothetical protein